jgi:hypothetical protein
LNNLKATKLEVEQLGDLALFLYEDCAWVSLRNAMKLEATARGDGVKAKPAVDSLNIEAANLTLKVVTKAALRLRWPRKTLTSPGTKSRPFPVQPNC